MPTAAETPNANGASRSAVEDVLQGPLTDGYRPSLPIHFLEGDWLPQLYLYRDVELMRTHQTCLRALEYYKSGVSGAEFWGGPTPGYTGDPGGDAGLPVSDSPEVNEFVLAHCNRYWKYGVPLVQGGYEYGWQGLEAVYTKEPGPLCWHDFRQFSPRDTYLLTLDEKPVGVRVKNIRPTTRHKGGDADLWLGTPGVPSKGVWYAHQPRFNLYYGQSQYFGAWRPWRRLAWRDGGETVVDGGVYRFFYRGPTVRYPAGDTQASQVPFSTGGSVPSTQQDSQGRPRRPNRDVARQLADYSKAGAGFGLPSEHHPPEAGGGPLWDVDYPETTLNVSDGIAYLKFLQDQIYYGVGVPPELLSATETGSGYSGRAIPFESFLAEQQRLADALLRVFVEQVLRPLVRWNFGGVKFRVEVKDLLATKRKRQAEGQAAPKGAGETRVGAHAPSMGEPPLPAGAAEPPGAGGPMPPTSPAGGFSLTEAQMEQAVRIAAHARRQVALRRAAG